MLLHSPFAFLSLIVVLILVWIFFAIVNTIKSWIPSKEEKLRKEKEIERTNLVEKKTRQRELLGINHPFIYPNHYPKVDIYGFIPNVKPPIEFGMDFIQVDYFSENEFPASGRADFYFLKFLQENIDKDKFTSLKYKCLYYFPDIVYADFNKQIFIDIEIDEPYTISNKIPIHYIGKDKKRDLEISMAGWRIIRFTERQVFLYPMECCKFVAEVISYLTLDKAISNKFNSIQNVPFEKEWSIDEAKQFALSKYRDTYTKKILD